MDYNFSIDSQNQHAQLAERIRQYTERITEYTRPTYNETEVRVDFVNPLFKALG